jgi:hypothetical protein
MHKTFTAWLLARKQPSVMVGDAVLAAVTDPVYIRSCHIADLANDAKVDPAWPTSGSRKVDFIRYLEARRASPGALRAFEEAWGDWKLYRTEVLGEPAQERGFVYFICTDDGEFVKIGWAADPEKRLAQLQTGNPKRLVIVATLLGDRELEAEAHEFFRPASDELRVGEWFPMHAGLASSIAAFVGHRTEIQVAVDEAALRKVIGDSDVD